MPPVKKPVRELGHVAARLMTDKMTDLAIQKKKKTTQPNVDQSVASISALGETKTKSPSRQYSKW